METHAVPATDDPDKFRSKSVSLTEGAWSKVETIVSAEFRGNRSTYFGELIQADFKRRGITDGADTISELVRELVATRDAATVLDRLQALKAEFALAELATAGDSP